MGEGAAARYLWASRGSKAALTDGSTPCWLARSSVELYISNGCMLQVEQERDFGEGTTAVDLVEGGDSKAVTNENRAQFVEVYVEHLLLKSVEKQRNAFCRGFHKVGSL